MTAPIRSEDRAQALFDAALQLPVADRDGFLDRECSTDTGLRRKLEKLLHLHQQAEDVLRDPTEPVREQPGDRIGHYKLLQQIGEGGFGTVWMAEQEQPVRRKVALKVLKAGMDTAQVIGRFEAERQALAMMDHPHIAKVFDGGATPQGRPYFVMELVKGVPITQFCDDAGLSTPQRLELFVPVCQAVQHAHQKGVIHRDLKPTNVLVTLHDGVPVPKVIDFGIAKATQGNLTDKTVFTGFQQMLGTPEYMAPEQAELSGLDIDTRADIYSLGVLLYELLTGTRPFELKTLLHAGYAEMVRTIKEVDPPKPSTRVSTLGDQQADIARHRRVHPKGLGALMRGDLDWIVMKALEKERSRRYDTATALGDDVLRHLHHEPVLAGRPSRLYRLRKYARRHRVGVVAGSAIGLAISAGAIAAILGYVEAHAALRQADEQRATAVQARAEEQAQRQRAEEREAVATREATKNQHLVDLLQQMLAGGDPDRSKGKDYKVRDLLDDFDRDLGLQLEPEVELGLRRTLARSYLGLGLPDRAAPHLQRAEALTTSASGLDPLEVARVKALQAQHLWATGGYAEAMAHYAALAQHQRGHAPDREVDNWRCQQARCAGLLGDHGRAIEILETLAADVAARDGGPGLDLAMVQQFLSVAQLERNDPGDLVRAEQLARECLETQRELLPADDHAITTSSNNLATVLGHLGRWAEARALLDEVLQRDLDRYGPDHVRVAFDQTQLGFCLCQLGEPAQALPLLLQAVATYRHQAGNALDLANALNQLGSVYYTLGRNQDAIEPWTEALAIRRRELGDHDGVARTLQNLAVASHALGKVAQARQLLEEALAMRIRVHGPDHLEVAMAQAGLGVELVRAGELDAGEALLQAALATRQRDLPAPHAAVAEIQLELADCLYRQGRNAAAAQLAEEALAGGRPFWPPQSRGMIRLLTLLGQARWQLGELAAAEAAFAEVVRTHSQFLGPQHQVTLAAKPVLAWVLLDQGAPRAAEAEQLVSEVHAAVARSPGASGPLLAPFLVFRAKARLLAGRAEAAEQDLQEALELCREAKAPDPVLARSQLTCGEYLLARGRADEAEPLLRQGLEVLAQQDPDSPYRWIAASALGGALLQQGKYAAAEPLLLEAIAKLPFPMGMPDGRARRQTLQRLVELYEKWGKPEPAESWRQQLRALEAGR